jgi:hypothetical protein
MNTNSIKGGTKYFFLVLFCLIAILPGTFAIAGEADKPWRLQDSLHLPTGLTFWGQHRIQYETIDHQFRANSTGSDQTLFLRTFLNAQWQMNSQFKIHLEMGDARALLNDTGSRVSNNFIDAAELLQAYVGWSEENLFAEGSDSVLRAGRITMDIGSRRLIGRNGFRNFTQAYTGLDFKWTGSDETQIRTIFTLPISREPSTDRELLSNKAEFDEESFDEILWGAFVAVPHLLNDIKGELYFFGYNENDSFNRPTRDRDLYTTGFRVYESPESERFDFEWESMIQAGTVRASALASDTKDLDHLAYFTHAGVGYTFRGMWKPRLLLEYDFASGDNDPNDGDSGGFDSLYGLNAGDWGPTDIYTAFVRSNISSPGMRFRVQPIKNVTTDFGYRAMWLASSKDAWQGASGIRDVTGNSGKFLGHQVVLKGTWSLCPNIKLGGGLYYRIDGEFQENAPASPHAGNTLHTYFSSTFLF